MRFVRSTYPAAIVDFGRSVSIPALDALPELETLYLITTAEPACLAHAKRALRMVEERGFAGHRVKVLVNRVPQKSPPDPARLEQQLGRAHAGLFASDFMAFYEAYSEGHLLEPGSRIRKELTALSATVSARILGDRETDKKNRRGSDGPRERRTPLVLVPATRCSAKSRSPGSLRNKSRLRKKKPLEKKEAERA